MLYSRTHLFSELNSVPRFRDGVQLRREQETLSRAGNFVASRNLRREQEEFNSVASRKLRREQEEFNSVASRKLRREQE